MSSERDDYMRRQEADHALLRMRDPRPASFAKLERKLAALGHEVTILRELKKGDDA